MSAKWSLRPLRQRETLTPPRAARREERFLREPRGAQTCECDCVLRRVRRKTDAMSSERLTAWRAA